MSLLVSARVIRCTTRAAFEKERAHVARSASGCFIYDIHVGEISDADLKDLFEAALLAEKQVSTRRNKFTVNFLRDLINARAGKRKPMTPLQEVIAAKLAEYPDRMTGVAVLARAIDSHPSSVSAAVVSMERNALASVTRCGRRLRPTSYVKLIGGAHGRPS